jgi:GrpB-like predicted nucleotidyltransferase (UPF0157 family)
MSGIVIVEYDPSWPSRFATLAATVTAALGPVLVRVEHVGSTAVPGLPAKPVIDIDAVVRPADVVEAIGRLAAVGYIHQGERGVAGREAFAAPAGAAPHHLYVCPVGSPALAEHLQFRDALRADGRLAAEYGRLKRRLAARFGRDRDGYCEAKTGFIRAVLARQAAGGGQGDAADPPAAGR